MGIDLLYFLSKEIRTVPSTYSRLKKFGSFHTLKNNKLTQFLNIIVINNILFYLIFASLLKQILSNYIEITVNQSGEQQIISNEFSDHPPSRAFIGATSLTLIGDRKNRINVNLAPSTIKLEWDNCIVNFSNMFSNLENIIEVKITNLLCQNSIFSFTFSNCINLVNFIIDNEYLIRYAIKDMRGMFYNCQSLFSFSFKNLYLDYYMLHCFWYQCYYDCYVYNHFNDYYNCYRESYSDSYDYYYYTQLDYYLYNAISMSYMFYNCISLKYIMMDSYPIKNISDMSYMFYNCISLKSIDLEKFETSNYLNIDLSYMFYNCYSLTSIKFNPTYIGVNNMSYMFYNCNSLKSIDLSKFSTANYKDDNYDFLYIDLSYLFFNCYELETIIFNSTNNIFGVKKLDYMFYNCSKLNEISLKSFNTYNYCLNMSYLFYNCQNLINIDKIDNYFYIDDVRQMFYNCNKLEQLIFYPYYIYQNINMSKMFYNCNKLQINNFN